MRWVLLLALVAVASLQHTGVGALTNPVDKKALLAFKAGITQVIHPLCKSLSATVVC